MTITYRRPTDDEYVPMVRTFVEVMNQRANDEDLERDRELSNIELARSWVADDDGTIVGTTTAHSFALTVPGGASATLAGLTLVSVIPTHRRRGIMSGLMRRFFDE